MNEVHRAPLARVAHDVGAAARVTLRRYWPALLATVALLPHARAFDFLTDDGYISFRYARNLALHGELVFNLGERVEGYTNFLWTVLLALGIKLGVPPETSARALGVLCAIGGLMAVTRLSLRLDGERPHLAHAIAPLGLAATSAYACWTTGGLETQLFTFLFVLAVDRFLAEALAFRGYASALFFAGCALTRPEGVPLFALAVLFRLGHNLLAQRRLRPNRDEWLWLGLFAAVFAPYFVWRWRYYGWPLPNTFYVKSSGAAAGATAMGLYYLRRFAEDHTLWFWIPLVLLGWPRPGHTHRRMLFEWSALVALFYALYVVKVGGDFMGLYRFVLPTLPLGVLCVQEAARNLHARLRARVPWPALALAGLALAAGHATGMARVSHHARTVVGADRGIDSPAYLKRYVEERVPIGLWLRQHACPDDLMTVGGAGVIPYYSGIRAHDVFGLVDERIAHDPSMTVSARPGHQKWGSDEHMLSRRPTLVTHYYHLHARAAPDAERWHARGYAWVTATIPGLSDPPLYSFLKRRDRAFGPFPAESDAPPSGTP